MTHQIVPLLLAGLAALAMEGARATTLPAYAASARAEAGASVLQADPFNRSNSDSPPPQSASGGTAGPVTAEVRAYTEILNPPVGDVAGAASGRAEVTPGRIALQALGSGTGSYTSAGFAQLANDGSGGVTTSGSFEDWLVFDVAGMPAGTAILIDTAVQLTASPSLVGNLVGGGWGRGSLRYTFTAQLYQPQGYWAHGFQDYPMYPAERYYDGGTLNVVRDLAGTYLHPATLVWTGLPTRLTMSLELAAFGRGGSYCYYGCGVASVGAVDAIAQAALSWQGVSGVTLLDGTVVPAGSLSIQSASGFDYSVSAVPEPPAALLWLAGGACVAGLVRRRRPG